MTEFNCDSFGCATDTTVVDYPLQNTDRVHDVYDLAPPHCVFCFCLLSDHPCMVDRWNEPDLATCRQSFQDRRK